MTSIDERLARLISKTAADRDPPDWARALARRAAARARALQPPPPPPIGDWFIDESGNPTRIVGGA